MKEDYGVRPHRRTFHAPPVRTPSARHVTTYRQRIVALFNDDSSPVGQVHIGVVHLFDLDTEDGAANEAPITSLEFLSRDELESRRDKLETWSVICLVHLDRIMG